MNLAPFKHPADVSVAIRDELYVVAAIMGALAELAAHNFHEREEHAGALVYSAQGQVERILNAIEKALAEQDSNEERKAA